MTRIIRSSVSLCAALVTTAATAQTSMLRVTDAWIRSGPPGASVLAGYMTVVNSGREDLKITAAASPQFGMIELHRTVIEDGVARMRKQPYFLVPAGGKLELAPNDRHLMMIIPSVPLQPGDRVTVVLTLDHGAALEIDALLR